MAIIRVQKTENYTVMSNHHLRNQDLSLKAKGLMSMMLSLPPGWDFSIAGLVSICKESHTSVRSALKDLEDNHYLIRRRTNSEKGYFIYEYNLYEIPNSPLAENLHTVELYTDNAHTDLGHTENRTQLNKDKLNKDELNKEVLNKEQIADFEDILSSVTNLELRNLYVDYIEMRRIIKAPLTKRGLAMLIDRCDRLSNFKPRVAKTLLETAIINNWKNVYAVEDKVAKKAQKQGFMDQLQDMYDQEV